jgi:hypothetical protein
MLSLLSTKPNILTVADALSSSPNFLNVKHDTENNLYIAKHCHKSDTSLQLVQESDGTILDSEATVVCYSGPYHEIMTVSDLRESDIDLSTSTITESLDGTMIRLYYHNNQWCVATKGHTDASKSKWSSDKNFRQLFDEALENHPEYSTDTFCTHCTYVFLLQHTDNKIVCPVEKNQVFLVDVFNNKTLECTTASDVFNFQRPRSLGPMSIDQLSVFVTLGEETVKGVMITTSDHRRICVLSELYENRQHLKGNQVDMERQYLTLRSGNNHYKFTSQFPEYVDMVKTLESNLRSNTNHIHSLYMAKHIKKQQVTTTPEENKILFSIHGFYLRTRCIVRKELVENLLFVIDRDLGLRNISCK